MPRLLRKLASRWKSSPKTLSARDPRVKLMVQGLESRIAPANFTVTNTLDSGTGSLRQAILDANAATGDDSITFDSSFNTPKTITLTTGQLAITDGVTITGPGSANLTITGNNTGRVFNIDNPAGISNVTITGLTVTGGFLSTGQGDGAGISMANENVTLDRVVVTGNTITGATDSSGGGISVGTGGFLTVRNSTVSGNSTTGRGGGIYFYFNGSLSVENSTISGNSSTVSANGGGGIYFYGTVGTGGFTISNSTISGNSSTNGSGGGIVFQSFNGTINIRNSTITLNSSGTASTTAGFGGGGIAVSTVATGATPVLNLVSTIVSGNTASTANGRDDIAVAASVTVNANNSAIFDADGFTLSGTSGSNLAFGTALNLGGLSNNGGPTQTHALGSGSPAIDAGSNPAPVLLTDQRGAGFPRVSGATADIGAFEVVQATSPPIATATASNITTTGVVTYSFTVTYSDATAINVGTLDSNDIRVTGPLGYNQLATFVSVTPAGNGTPRTATYSITAPILGTSAFDPAENGTYTVSIEANQVSNTGGLFVPSGSLTTFQALVPATFVVTTTADSGTGSLRDVMTQANAFASVDTIVFDPTVFNTAQTISLLSALPVVINPLTITGPGANLLTVRRDPGAATNFRIFSFGGATAFAVTLSGVTVTGGATAGTTLGPRGGGGISANGIKNLTVLNAVVTGNSASGEGGGIYMGSGGTLTVRNSTISGNTAGTDAGSPYRVGGGIYMRSGGTLLVENSTISGNTTPTSGGGVYMYNSSPVGNYTIRNSTISGNSAATGAGLFAVTNSGTHTLQIQNSTIAGNTATTSGGGLSLTGTSLSGLTTTLFSSVVAFNTAPAAPDVDGTANASFSLVRDQTGSTLPNYATQNNLPALTDPLFVGGSTPTLANNGGPTRTIALQAGSPLRNTGSNLFALLTDQRGPGFARTSGSGTDIGAFEIQAPPQVSGVEFNPSAVQRSRVTSMTVTFNTVVTFAGPVENAFVVARSGGSAVGSFTASAATVGGVTVVTITSFAGAQTESGSLADGYYTVTVKANQVSTGGGALDGDGNGTGGDDYILAGTLANKLFRLYGDVSGDGTVSGGDLGVFRGAFGSSTGNPNYLDYLDFDNNGSISGNDLGNFRIRFGTSVP